MLFWYIYKFRNYPLSGISFDTHCVFKTVFTSVVSVKGAGKYPIQLDLLERA
jgi:hypothetical protein